MRVRVDPDHYRILTIVLGLYIFAAIVLAQVYAIVDRIMECPHVSGTVAVTG